MLDDCCATASKHRRTSGREKCGPNERRAEAFVPVPSQDAQERRGGGGAGEGRSTSRGSELQCERAPERRLSQLGWEEASAGAP